MSGRNLTRLGTLALFIALTAVAPAAAATSYYTVTISPSTVTSGTRSTVAVAIKRLTAGVAVHSANITAPPGFSIVSASLPGQPAADSAVSANTAQLRNLDFAAGATKTATLVVDAPCAPTSATWTEAATSTFDHSGPVIPDNGANALAMSSSGTCSLSFSTQPADVQVASTITGTAGDPGGPPVAVSVLDGAGTPATAATTVTMGLGSAPSGGALTGTTTAVTSGGVATFGQLMVSPAGTYTLVASVPGGAAATSTPFKASQSLVACSDNVFCTASASTTGTVPGSAPAIPYTNTVAVDAPDNSGVNADGGTLAVSFDVGPNVVNCAGYGPASPDREVVDGVNREKTVTSVVAKALLVATGRTAASLKTCLLAPYQFNLGLPLIGGVATPVGDPDGDGVPDFLGVLPRCLQILPPLLGIPILIAAPCQISATADAQGNGVVRYLLKADPHDPAARH